MTLVYVIAGEASGDVLGARLIAALRAREPGLEFCGVGGARMAEQGFSSLFPMRELALMGLLEVLPNIRRLARRIDETCADIAARRPDAIVTIDSPGFTLRVAGRVRGLGIPLVHYVAPQHWGWRPGRVKKLAAKVDRVLALLPFEAAWFETHGIGVDFVGHPVLESGLDAGDGRAFRARHGVAAGERLVMVMPGSRRTEVSRLLPVFGAALAMLPAGLRAVVPLAGPVEETVRAGVAGWPLQPILLRGVEEKADAFAACEAGLIKSGTSTLEAAVAGLPHLVAYKVNPVTAAIVRRLMDVRFISIVNLLAGREVAPEFVQDACTPEILAQGLRALLDGGAMPTKRAWNKVREGHGAYGGDAASQRAGFAEVLGRLAPAGMKPSEAAAEAVLRVMRGGVRPAPR